MLRKLLFNPIIARSLSPRLCSTETLKPTFDIPQKLKKPKDQPSDSTHGFETLLRNSTFTQMGDPVGKVCNFKNKLLSKLFMIFLMTFKVVVGKIYHVVDDDLYIDFGSKVCECFFFFTFYSPLIIGNFGLLQINICCSSALAGQCLPKFGIGANNA